MPAFEAYARKAGLEGPLRRELLWKTSYQAANTDVFSAFEETVPMSEGGTAQTHATEPWTRTRSQPRSIEEALTLAERAIAVNPIEKDAISGPSGIEILARVTAQVGEQDRAIAALEKLLSIPYAGPISVPLTSFYFKPLSHKRIIQIQLEELAKCFKNARHQYKYNELMNLSKLLEE